jgi:nucleoside-diphosphate-sugar epimerase
MGLTVAVTGLTGDIGKPAVRALEESEEVERIVGMARRPFDPAAQGWKRTEYQQGDMLDGASVEALVEGADVVVHLAFVIFGSHDETRKNNLEGSRNVFEAAVAAGAKRLVYASSVAAYGFHADNPQPLTEEVEPRGTEGFYYSAQKAELEALLEDLLSGSQTEAYVLRPCIVAGPEAPTLIEEIVDMMSIGGALAPAQRLLESLPVVAPVLPDPGVPFQLVHHDDVATAIRSAALGHGEPGVYNIAAEDPLTTGDIADALGWRSIPIPSLAIDAATRLVGAAPLMPARAGWINAFTVPVVMDCAKARRELGWPPERRARDTLVETVAAARAADE